MMGLFSRRSSAEKAQQRELQKLQTAVSRAGALGAEGAAGVEEVSVIAIAIAEHLRFGFRLAGAATAKFVSRPFRAAPAGSGCDLCRLPSRSVSVCSRLRLRCSGGRHIGLGICVRVS